MSEPRRYSLARGKAANAAPWALLAGCLAAAALGLANRFPAVIVVLPRCPLLALAGVPCPTCRSSRALLALAHGQVELALAYHPLAVVAMGLALVCGPWAAGNLLVPRFFPFPELEGRRPVLAARTAAIVLLLNWGYLLASLSPG